MKKYSAKVTKWGKSLGLRIPAELIRRYGFSEDKSVILVPEPKGIKILPQ